MKNGEIILGAGITGLSAGVKSGFPIFEAGGMPGGLCSSYYMRPGAQNRLYEKPDDGEAYRFEFGGGHWIFGCSSELSNFLNKFVALKEYTRRSSVYFRQKNIYVPFPIQNNLRNLNRDIADRSLSEMGGEKRTFLTMKDWLRENFGPTLCDLFFFPFHERYTAGLFDRIAPQDTYKSPVDLSLVLKGASEKVSQVGYNVSFLYPKGGLNLLTSKFSEKCDIRYNKSANRIDPHHKVLSFEDSTWIPYDRIISTLPLNQTVKISGIELDAEPDPFTSVLVLNIGAERGPQCPDDHWLYIPDSGSGFYRIGFYTNVDPSFLPLSNRETNDKVGIYVEKAYPGGKKPSDSEIQEYVDHVLKELQDWNFIGNVEVSDYTWIEVAYTWSGPNSEWKQKALKALENHNILQIGRYGRWTFQGIAESIMEGLSTRSSVL